MGRTRKYDVEKSELQDEVIDYIVALNEGRKYEYITEEEELESYDLCGEADV